MTPIIVVQKLDHRGKPRPYERGVAHLPDCSHTKRHKLAQLSLFVPDDVIICSHCADRARVKGQRI